jgi:hypothetical protein
MQVPQPSIRRIGEATAVWGVLFAAFHFYWAAGGAALGVGDDQLSLGASLYIAVVAILGLVGAAVAHGLYRPWGIAVGRHRLRLLARIGAVALLLGVATGVGRWIAAASLGDDGAGGIVITAYFLIGGLLFAVLGWRSGHEVSEHLLRADRRPVQPLPDGLSRPRDAPRAPRSWRSVRVPASPRRRRARAG